MELAPITDIFVQEHLYRYGIEANKIRDWFLDLDKDFCTNINVKSPKDKRIPCKKPAPGCGIDDSCKINEICKSGFDGKYVCGKGNEPTVSALTCHLFLFFALQNFPPLRRMKCQEFCSCQPPTAAAAKSKTMT